MIDPFVQLSSAISATTNLAVAGLLVAFWLHDRTQRWNLFWACAYGLTAFGLGIWLIWQRVGGEALIGLASIVVAGAATSLLVGIEDLAGRKMPPIWIGGYIAGLALLTFCGAQVGNEWGLVAGTWVLAYGFGHSGARLLREGQWAGRAVGALFMVRALQLACSSPLVFWGYAGIGFIWGHFMVLSTGFGLLFIGFVYYSKRLEQVQAELTERNAALTGREQELMATNSSLEVLAVQLELKTQEYAEQRNRADAANQAKSQFLANMSHELRTPLNAIIGFAELIAAMPGDARGREKGVEYSGYIGDAGHHLLNVVNNLLDLARIELNALELSFTLVKIADLANRAVLLLQFALTEKQIAVAVDIPAELEAMVDPQLMRQALVNVIGNAVKFSPTGSIVRVSGGAVAPGGLQIVVSDSGPGIDETAREKVFEPFWQTEDVFSRQHGGIGLGLSITRRIIEEHGGTIIARNGAGGGAEIVITLPPNPPVPGG